MGDPVNLTVFLIIVISRLAVPLFIPRFPLPGIVASMILDAIDGDALETFTTLPLDDYQSYDKALDIYYLTIAYLSTMRNWVNTDAFVIARFLIYYRLVGVLAFESTQQRWLLFVFPNTFEYFFVFYELVRLRWNPVRISRKAMLAAAAAIWIVIKLPQEYWIHIAQRDVTETLGENPALIPLLLLVIAGLLLGLRWLMINRLPAPDRSVTFDMGHPVPGHQLAGSLQQYISLDWRSQRLPEKVVLVTLVTVIFSQILPDIRLTGWQLAFGVGAVIVANTVVTEWLSHRRSIWHGVFWQFATMAVINVGIFRLMRFVLPGSEEPFPMGHFLFFLFLVSLLITMFDLFMSIYQTKERVGAK